MTLTFLEIAFLPFLLAVPCAFAFCVVFITALLRALLLSPLGGLSLQSFHAGPLSAHCCSECCVWLCCAWPCPAGGQPRGLMALPLSRLPEEARHRRVFEMVEALQEHPRNPTQVLIGYSRGLVVVWDLQGSRVLCHFLSSQVGGGWDGGRHHVALPHCTHHLHPWRRCRGAGMGSLGPPP